MTNDLNENPKKGKRLVLTKETLRVYTAVRAGIGNCSDGRPPTPSPLRDIEPQEST